MVTRRDFLKSSIATLVLIPLVGCSDDDTPTNPGAGGGATCEGVSSTGSNSGGHAHTVCVASGDLTSPPASGRTYITSSNARHTHSITLSQAELQTVASGGSVNVKSSSAGHTHDFVIQQA